MQKILFNKLLIPSVLDGTKTMTRRIVPNKVRVNISTLEEYHLYDRLNSDYHKSVAISLYSRYKVGEIVAVAQPYKDCYHRFQPSIINSGRGDCADNPGWNNSMFVRADLMPHQIQITDIKVERLQDISDEDCIKEGIIKTEVGDYNCVDSAFFENPRDAFAMLIDEVSGKGTWECNPWVFAYSFELACASFAQRQ